MWFHFWENCAEMRKELSPAVLVIKLWGTTGVLEGGRDQEALRLCMDPAHPAERGMNAKSIHNVLFPTLLLLPWVILILLNNLYPSRKSPTPSTPHWGPGGNLGLSHPAATPSPCTATAAASGLVWDEIPALLTLYTSPTQRTFTLPQREWGGFYPDGRKITLQITAIESLVRLLLCNLCHIF